MFLGFLTGVMVTITFEVVIAFYFIRKEEKAKHKKETEKQMKKLRAEFNKVIKSKKKERNLCLRKENC